MLPIAQGFGSLAPLAHGGQPTFQLAPSRLQPPARGSPPPSPSSSEGLISTMDLIAGLRSAGIYVDNFTEVHLADLRITPAQADRALEAYRTYEDTAARVAVETRTASIPGVKRKELLPLFFDYLLKEFDY